MTKFKNQIAIVRQEMKQLGFRNIQLNKSQADWFAYGAEYDSPGIAIPKRAVTQDFLELFTYNLPEKNKFATIGFSYSYKDLEEKDFSVQISCFHKTRSTHKHAQNFIQNKVDAGFDSKHLTLDEFKDFLTNFTAEISKENSDYKKAFEWIHANYNEFSFVVDENLQKRRAKIKAV